MASTPLRTVRVPDDLWQQAGQVARAVGYPDLSAYLRDALAMLVQDGAVPWDLREA